MKKELRVNFTDFPRKFNKTNNNLFHLLSRRYTIIIDEINPDYLFYGSFGYDFLRFDCIRIFYTGENIMPDFNLCDYASSFAFLSFDDRYVRFPGFHHLLINREIKKEKDIEEIQFCNFIYSNANRADPTRDEFYHLLSKYKHVDSAGKHLNNKVLPVTKNGWVNEKLEFMSNYKFSIAFENSSLPGYTTEKISHAFIAGTIPIYWGSPLVIADFNPAAFINCHAYSSLKEVVDKVIELDQDNDLYLQMYNQPVFIKEPAYMQEDYLLNFYSYIIEQPYATAWRRTKYGHNNWYEGNLKKLVNEFEAGKKSFKGIKHFARKILRKFTKFK